MWITLFCVYAESELVYTSVDNFLVEIFGVKVDPGKKYIQQKACRIYIKKNNKILDNTVYTVYILCVGKSCRRGGCESPVILA